jgi:hypothetical protein
VHPQVRNKTRVRTRFRSGQVRVKPTGTKLHLHLHPSGLKPMGHPKPEPELLSLSVALSLLPFGAPPLPTAPPPTARSRRPPLRRHADSRCCRPAPLRSRPKSPPTHIMRRPRLTGSSASAHVPQAASCHHCFYPTIQARVSTLHPHLSAILAAAVGHL